MMLAEINKRLSAAPYVPFTIVTSSGKEYVVPTPDHCTVTRLLREVIVERDDGSASVVNLLHVTAIEKSRRAA